MKILIETWTEKDRERIYTSVDYDLESLTNNQVSFAIAELEKIKLELIELWKKGYDIEVKKEE